MKTNYSMSNVLFQSSGMISNIHMYPSKDVMIFFHQMNHFFKYNINGIDRYNQINLNCDIKNKRVQFRSDFKIFFL
jgi:hypothetical protein